MSSGSAAAMALTQEQQMQQQMQNLMEKQLEDEKHLEDTLKVKQAELLNAKTEISILTKEYNKMMNRIAGKMASALDAVSLGQPEKKKRSL
jgi:hypothetical protein